MFDPATTITDFMSVVLTHDCPRACPFCIDKYRGSGEYISAKSFTRAVATAVDYGVRDLLLVGGEPTLHKYVVDFAREARAAKLRVILTTNYARADVMQKLDGIVSCFNVSSYGQVLPHQRNFVSDITISKLLWAHPGIATKEHLDAFIDTHRGRGHLKFSTVVPVNDWTAHNTGTYDWLDRLPCEWVVLFNEILGQEYRGTIIKRHDKVVNPVAPQSWKVHVDGTLSTGWERAL